MPKGRPVRSPIRQNIVEILAVLRKAYGYQIYSHYRKLFPRASMRSIYYHLNKGVQTGEFQIEQVSSEKGDYSWGNEAQKVYYRLGPQAVPKGDERVKKAFAGEK